LLYFAVSHISVPSSHLPVNNLGQSIRAGISLSKLFVYQTFICLRNITYLCTLLPIDERIDWVELERDADRLVCPTWRAGSREELEGLIGQAFMG
jgi:hypothetical protein